MFLRPFWSASLVTWSTDELSRDRRSYDTLVAGPHHTTSSSTVRDRVLEISLKKSSAGFKLNFRQQNRNYYVITSN